MAQVAVSPSPNESTAPVQKLPLFALTAMVVGSMVGSGIFSLPRTFGNATGPFGANLDETGRREAYDATLRPRTLEAFLDA
jgi:hypothetical protein